MRPINYRVDDANNYPVTYHRIKRKVIAEARAWAKCYKHHKWLVRGPFTVVALYEKKVGRIKV